MSRIMLPVDNFFRSARRWPERIAVEILENERGSKNYLCRFSEAVNALAAGLQAIDPEPQSRVGICAYNNYEHLLAWLAAYAAGKVWVPLNPRNGSEELDRIIALTEPSIIVLMVIAAISSEQQRPRLSGQKRMARQTVHLSGYRI